MKTGQFYQSKTDEKDIIEIKGVDIKSDTEANKAVHGNWIGIAVHRHSDLYIVQDATLDVDELFETYKYCADTARKVETIKGYAL